MFSQQATARQSAANAIIDRPTTFSYTQNLPYAWSLAKSACFPYSGGQRCGAAAAATLSTDHLVVPNVDDQMIIAYKDQFVVEQVQQQQGYESPYV